MLKKMMIKETSRSFNPYTVVPSAPVGSLVPISYALPLFTTKISRQGDLREHTEETSKEDSEQVVVLRLLSLLWWNWSDPILFDAGLDKFQVPLGTVSYFLILVVVCYSFCRGLVRCRGFLPLASFKIRILSLSRAGSQHLRNHFERLDDVQGRKFLSQRSFRRLDHYAGLILLLCCAV